MDWTASANAIMLDMERRRCRATPMATFDIHATLSACEPEQYPQLAGLPESYLAALYPMEAVYGPNYKRVCQFDAALTQTMSTKIETDPEPLNWILQFIDTYAVLSNADMYGNYLHGYHNLAMRFGDECASMREFAGGEQIIDFFDSLNNCLAQRKFGWRQRRRINAALRTPGYLETPPSPRAGHEGDDLLTVIDNMYCNAIQWLLHDFRMSNQRADARLRARHAAFSATLLPVEAVNTDGTQAYAAI